MTDAADFEAALRADPGDELTRLVFADYLDEHNEPGAAALLRGDDAAELVAGYRFVGPGTSFADYARAVAAAGAFAKAANCLGETLAPAFAASAGAMASATSAIAPALAALAVVLALADPESEGPTATP